MGELVVQLGGIDEVDRLLTGLETFDQLEAETRQRFVLNLRSDYVNYIHHGCLSVWLVLCSKHGFVEH
ncbi:hypothetical protein thsbcT34_49640 [Burkholderia contaminans]|nr:hypothetical protein Bcon01_22800 [Burkholderia contaminans]